MNISTNAHRVSIATRALSRQSSNSSLYSISDDAVKYIDPAPGLITMLSAGSNRYVIKFISELKPYTEKKGKWLDSEVRLVNVGKNRTRLKIGKTFTIYVGIRCFAVQALKRSMRVPRDASNKVKRVVEPIPMEYSGYRRITPLFPGGDIDSSSKVYGGGGPIVNGNSHSKIAPTSYRNASKAKAVPPLKNFLPDFPENLCAIAGPSTDTVPFKNISLHPTENHHIPIMPIQPDSRTVYPYSPLGRLNEVLQDTSQDSVDRKCATSARMSAEHVDAIYDNADHESNYTSECSIATPSPLPRSTLIENEDTHATDRGPQLRDTQNMASFHVPYNQRNFATHGAEDRGEYSIGSVPNTPTSRSVSERNCPTPSSFHMTSSSVDEDEDLEPEILTTPSSIQESFKDRGSFIECSRSNNNQSAHPSEHLNNAASTTYHKLAAIHEIAGNGTPVSDSQRDVRVRLNETALSNSREIYTSVHANGAENNLPHNPTLPHMTYHEWAQESQRYVSDDSNNDLGTRSPRTELLSPTSPVSHPRFHDAEARVEYRMQPPGNTYANDDDLNRNSDSPTAHRRFHQQAREQDSFQWPLPFPQRDSNIRAARIPQESGSFAAPNPQSECPSPYLMPRMYDNRVTESHPPAPPHHQRDVEEPIRAGAHPRQR
ncbi:hypothetical protein BDQ17DRAFT_1432994 [Cyathus striatus]|nr:hypothetical protein BDQ17DRAFT_1432994 [Cyathus striatus]